MKSTLSQRRHGRELAMKALFQHDLAQIPLDSALAYLAAEEAASSESVEFASQLIRGVTASLAKLDALLAQYAREWRVERIAHVDRNVLRLAIWEIRAGQAPVGVAINEAVELAKMYGGEDSSRFVNGILGQYARDHDGSDASKE